MSKSLIMPLSSVLSCWFILNARKMNKLLQYQFLIRSYQQREMLPNTQSANIIQYNPFPMLYVPVDPRLLMKLVENQEFLNWQVNSLQMELKQLKTKLQARCHQDNIESSFPVRKNFKKDHHCHRRGCNKKYSSRIALRAHQRKQHPSSEQNNQSYSP